MNSARKVSVQLPATDRCFGTVELALTTFYIAGPLLIAAELLKPVFSIPLLLLFGAWFWTLATTLASGAESQNRRAVRGSILVNWIVLITCLALCFVWVYLSGIGGFSHCRWDYIKHNFIFSNLMGSRLPISVPYKGNEVWLHYGLAYYITPVRLTELLRHGFDITLNFWLIFIYSLMMFISILLLAATHRISVVWLGLSLALVGGLDVLGPALGLPSWVKPVATLPYLNIAVANCLEWWGTPGAPGNLTTVLFWAPQHFFGALVGTALLYAFLQSSRSSTTLLANMVLLVAASAFWSPYVAIGLAVLFILELSANSHGAIRRLREGRHTVLLSWEGLAAYGFAGALCLFTWLYYTAAEPLSAPQLLLTYGNLADWLLTYVLNLAPFLLALAFVSMPLAWKGSQDAERHGFRRQLLWRFAGGLVMMAGLLSFNHGYGVYNDWATRTTLPLWIMLTVSVMQLVLSGSLKLAYRAVLLGVLLLSTASASNEFAQAILLKRNCAAYGSYRLEDLGDLASQYQGRRDSLLYSYFVRWR
jgi:hypothetical protein